MPVPIRTTDTQMYDGKSVICAKFVTYEESCFKFKKTATTSGDYAFQLVGKSDASRNISVVIGGVSKTLSLSASFTLQSTIFQSVTVSANDIDATLVLPAGTYWFYHVQLEKASTKSDWRPAPEDAEDYTNDATRESYDRATSYADMTAEQKAEAAVEAQTQASIFNKLTNNGQVQGIYLQNGKVYINASYIQTGTLSIKKGNLETFYANADTGVIKIVADEFSLSSGQTLDSTLADSKSYTDGKDSAMKSYVDSNDSSTLNSAKTYANSQDTINLASAKAYADTSSAAAVNAQTQATIFNKLTNNGQTQGIYLTGGKIYINASYINAGVLSGNYIAGGILADAVGNMSWNLETGALSAKRLSIDSPNFKLTENGALTATSGTLDYLTVKEHCNLAGVSSQVVSNARSDIENIIANTVTANYITSKSAVLGKMSVSAGMVNVDGPLYSSGIVSGLTVNGRNGFFTDGKEGITRSYTFRDPNGNDVLSFTLTNGILTAGGASNTYTFACTKSFKYTKSAIRFWAYASQTASSKTYYNQTFVSDISTSAGSYTITM